MRDWLVEGDEASVKAYALIDAMNRDWAAVYAGRGAFYPEAVMSEATARRQQGKIEALLEKMAARRASYGEGPRGE